MLLVYAEAIMHTGISLASYAFSVVVPITPVGKSLLLCALPLPATFAFILFHS